MKTTIHNHLRGENGCLGFYHGLGALLSAYPEGGLPGEFFINGETQSVWIWDSTGRSWYDTNHAAFSPFFGVVTTPSTFSPSVQSGEPACYIYIAGEKGSYSFSSLKSTPLLKVTTDSAAVVTLLWDGAGWQSRVTPLKFDDAIRPVYLYRGVWSPDEQYLCTAGMADVVYCVGEYYRVRSSAGVASQSPSVSEEEWEVVPHFAAVANELELKPGAVVNLDRQQSIRVTGNGSTWELGDGEIRHLPTGALLTQSGEFRFPAGKGEMTIGPQEGGFAVYSESHRKVLRVGLDANGVSSIVLAQPYEDTLYEVFITPQMLRVAHFDNADMSIGSCRISADGVSCTLKKSDDPDLMPGDLFVDEEHYVRQK